MIGLIIKGSQVVAGCAARALGVLRGSVRSKKEIFIDHEADFDEVVDAVGKLAEDPSITISFTGVRKPLFLEFVQDFFPIIHDFEFEIAEHHTNYAIALERWFLGRDRKSVINAPHRYSNTSLLTMGIIWALIKNPSSRFVYLSFSECLVKEALSQISDLVNSEKFQEAFPSLGFRAEGGRLITSQGGGVSGAFTFDLKAVRSQKEWVCGSFRRSSTGGLVVDHAIPPSHADDVPERYLPMLQELVGGRGEGLPVLLSCPRFGKNDPTAIALKCCDWTARVTRLPAEKDGVPTWPGKLNATDIAMRRQTSPELFSRLYQQEV